MLVTLLVSTFTLPEFVVGAMLIVAVLAKVVDPAPVMDPATQFSVPLKVTDPVPVIVGFPEFAFNEDASLPVGLSAKVPFTVNVCPLSSSPSRVWFVAGAMMGSFVTLTLLSMQA
jgi:hypothetical protein